MIDERSGGFGEPSASPKNASAAVVEHSSLGKRPRRLLFRNEMVQHGSLVFLASMVVNASNYALHLILSRRLTVAEYGAFASLLAIVGIATTPAMMLSLVVARFSAEYHAVGDRERLGRLFTVVTRLVAIVATILVIAGIIAGAPLAHAFKIGETGSMILTSAAISALLLLFVARGLLQGVQDFRNYALTLSIEAVARVGLCLSLMFAGARLTGVMLGYVLASSISYVYGWFVAKKHGIASVVPLHMDLRRLSITISGVVATTLANALLSFADVMLVKLFFSPEQSGIYGAISLSGKIVLFVGGFLPPLILPKAAARAAAGKSPIPLLVQAVSVMGFCSVVILGVYALAPNVALHVLVGGKYAAAAPLILPYGFAMAMLATTNLVTTYRIGVHRFGYVVPLLVVAGAEIVAISVHHRTLANVVQILVIGHGCSLAVALYGAFGAAKPLAPQHGAPVTA